MCGEIVVRNSPRRAVRIKSNISYFWPRKANSSLCVAIVRIELSYEVNQASNEIHVHVILMSLQWFKMASEEETTMPLKSRENATYHINTNEIPSELPLENI